jgi:S-adenosylmethionine:tRNA ribosyltransferase-isomerase
MRRADFHYELPAELIAQAPADRRDRSRLLCVGAAASDRAFAELPALVPEGAVVVVNDTRVIPARLRARKATGGAVELLFVEPAGAGEAPGDERWRCLARASKPVCRGAELVVDGASEAPALRVASDRDADGTVLVDVAGDAAALLARCGEVPLPPYIERQGGATDADRERYQTIFASAPGAVAAPTAGLHFTGELVAALERRGCRIAPLTLHVGLGTFSPVRADDLDEHRMHAERYTIGAETAALVSSGAPVVAVGTTCVRALESAALGERRVAAGAGTTDLFIRPGYRFRVVDHLVTNFHLPESTLLMLVCAFAGVERVLSAYRHAVAARYRFYSYGDAMLLSREGA